MEEALLTSIQKLGSGFVEDEDRCNATAGKGGCGSQALPDFLF
jgi:hypothetical protein